MASQLLTTKVQGAYLIAASLFAGGVFVSVFADSMMGYSNQVTVTPEMAPPPKPSKGPQFQSVTIDSLEPLPDEKAESPIPVLIEVHENGSVTVDSIELPLRELAAYLSETFGSNPAVVVSIDPDRDCPFRLIQNVIDACEDSSIRSFRIVDRIPSDDSSSSQLQTVELIRVTWAV